MTLVSIILGAAVAVGAQRVFEAATGATGLGLSQIIQAWAVFMFITGTYYHIYTVVSFFFILPSLLWVMIPTAVGVGVVMSAYSIGNSEHFLKAALVFYAFGCIVFSFALVERYSGRIGLLAHDTIDAARAYRVFGSEMAKNATCFLFMLIWTMAVHYATFVATLRLPVSPEIIFTLGTGTSYSIMVWFTERRFLPAVREIWQLDSSTDPTR